MNGSPVPARVAIIVRTKNRPLFLARALDDVLTQTFDDWHVVVVNDGGSRQQVEALTARRPRLQGRCTVLHHDESLGMEAASNAGLAAVTSEFVVVHDDDDTWHPEFLARTTAYLDASSDGGVGVRTEIVHERIDGVDLVETGRDMFSPEITQLVLVDALRHNRCVPIGLLYRRSLHVDVGLYDESLGAVGDWEFQLRVLQHHTLGFIDGPPLAYWHHRDEQEGPAGNSSVSDRNAHLYFDRTVRERYLLQYAEQNGVGALLYLAGESKEQADHLHRRLNYSEELLHALMERSARLEEGLRLLEAAVSDASLVSLVRRRYRRFRDRQRARRDHRGS